MLLGGLHKLTTLDFPGFVSCVVFTRGCNFRCPYCHNPELVQGGEPADMPERAIEAEDFFAFLRKRQELLDGVVISGGEPCIQTDLAEFCRKIKTLGYKLKLDSNGSRPDMLEKLLSEKLLDYVALDLKGLPEEYAALGLCSYSDFSDRFKASLELVRKNGIRHELRSTCAAPFISLEKIPELAWYVKDSPWFLQAVRLEKVLSPDYTFSGYSKHELESFAAAAKPFAPAVAVRS